MVLPLPITRPTNGCQQDHDKDQPCVGPGWLVLIKVVKLGLRIFRKAEEGRAMNVLSRGATLFRFSTSVGGLRYCGDLAHRWFWWDLRMRQGCPAHSTETVFWAVVVPAMGAADIHCFKHIAFVRWQKGCCRWKLLARTEVPEVGATKRLVNVDPACFTASPAAC